MAVLNCGLTVTYCSEACRNIKYVNTAADNSILYVMYTFRHELKFKGIQL